MPGIEDNYISDSDILRMYLSGYTIGQLVCLLRSHGYSKKDALEYVERPIYEWHLKVKTSA